ncbi:MAG: immunoglobulin domain-containing protein [Verrucomicrobia bacterium]|nr:immunoglobulin domain-containing protein [Verrucomicrobiota bacterium]
MSLNRKAKLRPSGNLFLGLAVALGLVASVRADSGEVRYVEVLSTLGQMYDTAIAADDAATFGLSIPRGTALPRRLYPVRNLGVPMTQKLDQPAYKEVLLRHPKRNHTAYVDPNPVTPQGVTAPAITSQPQDEAAAVGSNASFSVKVVGATPLTFRWYRAGKELTDGGRISGATTASLTLAKVEAADADSYFVVVSNAHGKATSEPAMLTVGLPPAITAQPQDESVAESGTANFSVKASGTAPLSYQWLKDGSKLSDDLRIGGAATAFLTISKVQPSDVGKFSVLVSNPFGSVPSEVALLTVGLPPAITAQPQDQTVVEGATATFNVKATGTAPLSYQWLKDGNKVSDDLRISGATSELLTIAKAQPSDVGKYSVLVSNRYGSAPSEAAVLAVGLPPVITAQPQDQTIIEDGTASFSVRATGTAPLSFQWLKDGNKLSDDLRISGAGTAMLTIARAQPSDVGKYSVLVSNRYGSAPSEAAVLAVGLPPVITAQPQDQTVAEGSTASFSVKATGTAPLSFQWLKDGNKVSDDLRVSGAMTAVLTISRVQSSDVGKYSVLVSNPFGSIPSEVALLALGQSPTITSHPQDQTVAEGEIANFAVGAEGTAPLSYQWLKDGNKLGDDLRIRGANTALLTISKVQPSDEAKYSVQVRNPFGELLSKVAVLFLGRPPTITAQPEGQTEAPGGTATFKLAATGTAPLSFQWRKDGSDLRDSARIAGATTATLTISDLQASDAGLYTVAVSNPFGGRTSVAAALVLQTTQELTLQFVLNGSDSVFFHLFNVLALGTIRADIEWQGDSRNLSASLTGRRRPALADPTEPYATATGPSPLALSYDVTRDDFGRGTGWRLIIKDPDRIGQARGTVRLSIPFDPALDRLFRREKVSLRSGDLWPSAVLQGRFVGDLAATRAEGLHAIISLTRAVSCDEADQLERLGLIRQSHLAKPGWHSFGLVRRGINLADPLLVAVLRRITPLDPEDKVDPPVLVGDFARFVVTPPDEPAQNYVLNADGSVKLSVLFAKDVPLARIREILRREGLAFSAITDGLWRVTLTPARLAVLAAYDEVEWIEAGPQPLLVENSNTRPLVNVDAVQNFVINVGAGTIAYNGLTGAGVTVGIHDSGVDATHPDLNVVADGAGVGKHATHVAGIVAASGAQSNQTDANGNPNNGTPFQWRGMAPNAALVDSGDLITAANLLTAIQNNSLDLVNHSHALGSDGNYDAQNQTVDQEIRGGTTSGGTLLPRRPQVYAAGNAGNAAQFGNQFGFFALTKQMKNAVVVGNWNAAGGANQLAGGSSMGPAYDGRLKPDLVAPGSTITSTGTSAAGCTCYCGNNANGYGPCSGTSMASPVVAGITALLLQGWQNTYSTPLGTTIDAAPPLPSTMRALLIQTATDIVNNNVRNQAAAEVDSDSNPANNGGAPDGNGFATATTGPDFTTGWGFVNAQAAVNILQEFRTEYGRPIPNRIIQDTVQQAQVREYDFVVDQVGPLQVTLAWDDVEAAVQNPATNPLLVNDLDLELVAPNGAIFYPWQLGQTIQDDAGNALANDAQPPGTDIQVIIPIAPGANPANPEYVPANALTGNGAWVAATGKDHLNNVEQVSIANVQADQIGHWKARVIGFDVRQGAQDFSVVGFPYPDLAELQASCSDKVGLPAFSTPLEFEWSVLNVGPIGTGVGFNYQVWLSRDFYVDASDVALVDANQAAFGALAAGATINKASSVQITQAQADTLLGNAPGTTTIEQLVSADVFLLVQADSGNAVLEHNEANVAFVQLARLVDVALVMDRSGSMNDSVPVSSGNRPKIDLLKDAANLFLDLMRLDAGDELGEVSFAGGVTTDFGPGGVLTPLTEGNLEDAKDAVDALSPGGSTNIRDAVQQGLDLITGAANASHRRVLIFFSDGMRTAGGDPTEVAFLNQFAANGVTIYSVGFGTQGGTGNAGIDVDLLGTLANANPGEPGFFHVTESAVALDKFFVNAVAGAVRSEVVVDPEGDLAAGQSATVEATLVRDDSFATFILNWDNPALDLALAVRSPTGLEVNAGNAATFADRVTRVNRPTYRLMTLRFPLTGGPSEDHSGRWRMIIRNPGAATVHYAASVISETTVRARWHQPQPGGGGGSFRPGNAIPLTVSVSGRGGTPISGARVIVTPNVPLVSLGNLLAAAGITPLELARVPRDRNGEPLSEQERLYLALLARGGRGALLPRRDLPSFELTASRAAGEYVGVFGGTRLAGPYNFVARVEGVAEDCERFQREVGGSVAVGPAPDAGKTGVSVGWIDPRNPGGGIVVTVTPVGSGGDYVGPGSGGLVVITPGGSVAPSSSVVDNLDGSYSQNFRIVEPGVASFLVRVGGINLPTVTANAGLPAPIGVAPNGGRNDAITPIEVFFAAGVDLTSVTGVSLVSGDKAILLDGLQVNAGGPSVRSQVPSGVTPGIYFVHVESANGRSPASANATFRVTGVGQDFPGSVGAVSAGLGALAAAGTQTEGLTQLGMIARDLRGLATGPTVTEAAKLAAYNEVTGLLSRGQGLVSESGLPAVRSLVNAAKIDARALSAAPAATDNGKNIRVLLGNGVETLFGSVLTPGQTTVRLKQGPAEIPETDRGSVHVAYDITTTAQLDLAAPIDVQIAYEETDFKDEARLRVLHSEGGQWMDRTANLDTKANVILARVGHLSEFVIVEPNPLTKPVLQALGFDTTGAFTLQLQGPPGAYEIQESTDLLSWTKVGSVNIDTSSASFPDATASRKGSRFYRAVRVQ